MVDSRFVEWGFLLVTLANVLLIGLVLILLWRRLFPRTDEATAEIVAPDAAGPAQTAAGLIADVQRETVLPLERAMSDSLALVGRLDEVDGAAYPDWKKTHQPQIDELLSHREDLEFKLDDLKSKLDRAHKLVTNLHGQNRELRGAEARLQRLSLDHDRLQASLVETRRERDELGATAARLGEELARLRQPPIGPAATAPAGADDPPQQELETLRGRLEEEQAKLSRTLVEKEFIEQVFIDTDAVTDDYQALQREHAALQEQLRALQTRLASDQSR